MIVFELTMPHVASWNGKWAGADRRYIRIKDERKVQNGNRVEVIGNKDDDKELLNSI